MCSVPFKCCFVIKTNMWKEGSYDLWVGERTCPSCYQQYLGLLVCYFLSENNWPISKPLSTKLRLLEVSKGQKSLMKRPQASKEKSNIINQSNCFPISPCRSGHGFSQAPHQVPLLPCSFPSPLLLLSSEQTVLVQVSWVCSLTSFWSRQASYTVVHWILFSINN